MHHNLELAKQMYESGNEELKQFALLNFPEINKEDYLYLKTDEVTNSLYIYYGKGAIAIGYISDSGNCRILSNDRMVNAYEKWRNSGMKYSDEIVNWRSGTYKLYILRGCLVLIRVDINCGQIYNFQECSSFEYCEDDNIRRFKHNNRPIIY